MKTIFTLAAFLLLGSNTTDTRYHGPRSSYYEIKREAEHHNAWAVHTMLDIQGCSFRKIRSSFELERCQRDLFNLMGVTLIGAPSIVYNESGYGYTSGYTVIQQANGHTDITFRVDEHADRMYIDICSCKYYDAYRLLDYIMDYFDAYDASIDITFRK